MQIIRTIAELKQSLSALQTNNISLIPTMGALHNGHMSLIEHSQSICPDNIQIISIFVNPLQFGVNEDFDKYPKQLDKDIKLCQKYNIDIIFAPEIEELYKLSSSNLVTIKAPDNLANCLCGKSRHGHFDGVLTIVNKLMNITEASDIFFGLKDYQQYLIIKTMINDLNININIHGNNTIRNNLGLALSSRNKYLNEYSLKQASYIYKALQDVQNNLQNNSKVANIINTVIQQYQDVLGNIEYFELRNNNNLELINIYNSSITSRLFIATRIDNIRLIDNLQIKT